MSGMTSMQKYDFSLTTRDGTKVENIQIYGRDMADAERKLRQMYMNCEIMQCREVETGSRVAQTSDIEDVLSLIAKEE